MESRSAAFLYFRFILTARVPRQITLTVPEPYETVCKSVTICNGLLASRNYRDSIQHQQIFPSPEVREVCIWQVQTSYDLRTVLVICL